MADDSQASDVGARYARALFDLAIETNVLDAVEADVKSLKRMIEDSADLRALIASPRYTIEEKAAALEAIAKHVLRWSATTLKFLGLVAGQSPRRRPQPHCRGVRTAGRATPARAWCRPK